jgi:hypothetical protein
MTRSWTAIWAITLATSCGSVGGHAAGEARAPAIDDAAPDAPTDPEATPAATLDVPAAAPAPDATRPWLGGERPMVPATSRDVPMENGGEVSLLPFDFDPLPVEARRYDQCYAAGDCVVRRVPQPATSGPDDPAVGMRWEDAETYCITRGLHVQSAYQHQALRDSTPGLWQGEPTLLPEADGSVIVTSGFRCVRDGTF